MFHMKPIAPTLRLTTTVLLARQVNRLTLISMAGVRALDLQVEPLPEQSGHALVAEFVAGLGEIPSGRRVLATFATEVEALRQLDRLTRFSGRGTAWLARAVAGVMILFAIWFLFFLPVETDRLTVPAGIGAGRAGPVARAPLARTDPGEWPPPALFDDPAGYPVSPASRAAAGRLTR